MVFIAETCQLKKINRPTKGVKKREWYTSNDYKHNRNQTMYASKGQKSILQQVSNGLVGEKHRKLIQFATLFHTWLHFVFQRTSSSVIWQISDAWTPHSIGVHYMAHKTNLAIQTLLHLQMVIRLEGFIYTLYNYFSNNLKKHLEFTKLVELMETKQVKILKNVRTHWICMLSPT